jgi:hypothetical protein
MAKFGHSISLNTCAIGAANVTVAGRLTNGFKVFYRGFSAHPKSARLGRILPTTAH